MYSGPVTVASTTTLNAIAYESGWTESAVASAVYTIQCSTVLQLPSWCSVAIGTSSPSDTTTWSNGTFNMSGGNPGTFWTGVADSFNFVYQANPLTGDGTVYARLLASTGGGIQGIMLRAGLGQEDAFVFLGTGYYPANPMMLASRLTAGAASSYTALTSLPMGDLKLSRVGNVVTGSISVDGINWTQVGSPVTFTAIQLYGGLVVAQDFGGYLQATATFDSAEVTGATPFPLGAVIISLTPSTSTLAPSQTLQFTATVTGSSDTAVTFALNPNVGTISGSGLYTAPITIAQQQSVTLTATSQADATKSGQSTIKLTVNAAPSREYIRLGGRVIAIEQPQ